MFALCCSGAMAFAQVGFFDQVTRLRSSTMPKGFPRAAISGRTIYVVWNEQVGQYGGTNVFFARSSDMGATFEAPRNISGLHSPDSDFPRIAVDGDRVYVVWTDYILDSNLVPHRQTMLSISDNGGFFNAPLNISNETHCDAMNADVAAGNGKAFVVWEKYGCGGGETDGVMLAVFSEETGLTTHTVTAPVSYSQYNPGLAFADGVLYVVTNPVVGSLGGPWEIHVIRSLDNGATFADENTLGASGPRRFSPHIAASGKKVYVVWVEDPTVDTSDPYNIGLGTSSDHGKTFSTRTAPNYTGGNNAPSIGASESSAAAIWFDGQGKLWYWLIESPSSALSPAAIYSTTASDGGGQAIVAVSDSGVFATWAEIVWNSATLTYESFDIVTSSLLDSDGDGLPDDWEKNGVPVGATRVKLPCTADPDTGASLCPDADHKDIYLEIDYLQGHKPHSAAVSDVVRAFKNAPVKNPDGATGINLHIIVDEELPHQNVVHIWDEFDSLKDAHLGSEADRASGDAAAIKTAKLMAFHYVLFAHQFSDEPGDTIGYGYSGVARIGGPDILVTLGAPQWAQTIVSVTGGFIVVHNVGSRHEQAGTLMHELGHNLGLHHGGDDEVGCKPNYLSVMSYSRQLPTLIATRPLDYSREKIDDLDESQLSEFPAMKVDGADLTSSSPNHGLTTIWKWDKATRGLVGSPLDWNHNGKTEVGTISGDINKLKACEPADGIGLLSGFDDWASIRYAFRATGPAAPGAPLLRELTDVEALTMHFENLEALDYHIQMLPPEAYDSAASAPQHLSDLRAMLMLNADSVSTYVSQHDFNRAASVLSNVRARMDGATSGDWITSPEAQAALLPEIDNMLLAFAKSADFAGGAPVANAGADQSVEEGSTVTLNGLQSYDPGGEDLSYDWRQIGGPLVSLSSTSSAVPTFTAPPVSATSVLTFQLVVNAGSRVSAPAFVNVTDLRHVNQAPSAVAGGNRTVSPNSVVMLDGSASYDPEAAALTYAWLQTAGPPVALSDSASVSPTFTAPAVTADTALTFQLAVSDRVLTSAPSIVTITVDYVQPAPLAASPVLVTPGLASSTFPAAMAVSGDSVYLAWLNDGINFQASQDGGNTFAASTFLARNIGYSGPGVWMAASGDNVYVMWIDHSTWGQLKLYVAASTDRGRNFATPVLINGSVEHAWPAPQLLAAGNSVYVAYAGKDGNVSEGKPVKLRVSRDAGLTYDSEVTISDKVYWQFDMSVDAGRVYAAWYEGATRGCLSAASIMTERIWTTVSEDDGRTFLPPVEAVRDPVEYRYFSGSTYCGSRMIGMLARNGHIQVFWDDYSFVSSSSFVTLKVTSSTDGGRTYGAPVVITDERRASDFESNSGNTALVAGVPDAAYVVWGPITYIDYTGYTDLKSKTSIDGYSSTQNLTSPDYTGQSSYSGAALAAHGNNSYVLWQRMSSGSSGSIYSYLLFASYDGGASYTAPVNVMREDVADRFVKQIVAQGTQFYILMYVGGDTGRKMYFIRGDSSAPTGGGTDATPPVIAPTITPAPTASGWNNSDVTVSWNVSDPESGISTSPGCETTTVSASTPGLMLTCSAYNHEGGSASRSVVIRLDKTPPEITGFRVTPASTAGWTNTDVEITFTCADDHSGLASCGPSPQYVSTEGAGQSASGSATDLAGNTTWFTLSNINVDKMGPMVVATASPAPNANGWNNTDVTVSFNGTDAVSGIAGCDLPVAFTTEDAAQTASGSCTDRAGNVSAPATVSISIDKTTPLVIAPPAVTVTATEAGGARGSASAELAAFLAAGSATDNLDPMPARLAPQSNAADVGNATLFAIGSSTISFRFMDAAGNIGSATATLNVVSGATPDYTLSSDRTNSSIVWGDSATFVITATPSNGFQSPITFTCAPPLPEGFACVFSPPVVTPNGSAVSTSLTIVSGGSSVANSRHSGSAVLSAAMGGFGLLGCLFLGRSRKRSGGWITLVLLLVAMAAVSVGCGHGKRGNAALTPTSTHAFQVNAVSGSVSHTMSLTLTVR
jgi:hypothetical protein